MTADQREKDPSVHNEPEVEPASDWEDAFQAEDYLIPTQTPPQTLFEDSAAGGEEPAESVPSPEQPSAGEQGSPAKRMGIGALFGSFLQLLGGNRVVHDLAGRLPSSLRTWSLIQSPRKRGAAILALAVTIGCLWLFWPRSVEHGKSGGPEEPPVVAIKEQPGQEAAEKEPSASAPSVEAPPPSLPAEQAPSSLAAGSAAPWRNDLDDLGSNRRKWRFSSFMINAAPDAEAPPSYVVVDLSLVLRLQEGEEFPEGKEYAVREMIYQFFSNRPLYELRRFAMARGEMKQKLQAWFQKEWPDNPIESVFFHRYQIL